MFYGFRIGETGPKTIDIALFTSSDEHRQKAHEGSKSLQVDDHRNNLREIVSGIADVRNLWISGRFDHFEVISARADDGKNFGLGLSVGKRGLACWLIALASVESSLYTGNQMIYLKYRYM